MAIQYSWRDRRSRNACFEWSNRVFREDVLDRLLFLRSDDVREADWWWIFWHD